MPSQIQRLTKFKDGIEQLRVVARVLCSLNTGVTISSVRA